MPIETLNDIIEDLANKLGVYGAHGDDREDDGVNGVTCTEDKPCRMCWTENIQTRIAAAVEVENKLNPPPPDWKQKIFTHKHLDPQCVETGCRSLLRSVVNKSIPVRGTCAISRDLWWCSNCKRGVGTDGPDGAHFQAGSWAFCPKCGVTLDWESAGIKTPTIDLDLNSKTSAGLPLTFGVEEDQLVIRIGVDTLAFCFEIGEDNQPYDDEARDFRRTWKVIDRHKFAKGVGIGLGVEDEDGSTELTRVLDKACIRAVEDDMGVDDDSRLVTEEMLHPVTI